jgi:hypothetical protein
MSFWLIAYIGIAMAVFAAWLTTPEDATGKITLKKALIGLFFAITWPAWVVIFIGVAIHAALR